VALIVPRVRDVRRNREVPLTTYQHLRQPRRAEETALPKILKGLSCLSCEACVEPAAETFRLTANSLSRRFKRPSTQKLAELQERSVGLRPDQAHHAEEREEFARIEVLLGEPVDVPEQKDQPEPPGLVRPPRTARPTVGRSPQTAGSS
jgi:hypothetical protein